jgi:ComF family protein
VHQQYKKSNFAGKFLNGIFNFILPPVCVCCDRVLQPGFEFVCGECLWKLKTVARNYNIFQDRVHKANFNGNAFSLYWFIEGTEIQHILHALKYSRMKSIGRLFGRKIGEEIRARFPGEYNYTVPVPLHRSKQRERTYNQSDYICRGISEALNIKPLEKCLRRTRYTKTQTKLSITEREENVRNAFKLNGKYSELIKGKNLILADDVITTGSTILECTRVLKAGGCGEVTVCSIALAE